VLIYNEFKKRLTAIENQLFIAVKNRNYEKNMGLFYIGWKQSTQSHVFNRLSR
jgi:hypothetical protein